MKKFSKPIVTSLCAAAALVTAFSKSAEAQPTVDVQTIVTFPNDVAKRLEAGTVKIVIYDAQDFLNQARVMMAVQCDKAGSVLRMKERIQQRDAKKNVVITTITEFYDKSGKIRQNTDINYPSNDHTFRDAAPTHALNTDFKFPLACNGKTPDGYAEQMSAPLPANSTLAVNPLQPH